MAFPWIEKIKQAAKVTWNKLSTKLPTPKTVGSYFWKIVVDGSARGVTFGTTFLEAFRSQSKLLHFSLPLPFLAASILRKIGKGSQYAVLRGLNIIGREFQKSLNLVPPLVGLCMVFNPQSSEVLISIFFASVGISVGKRLLENLFKKKVSLTNKETTIEIEQPSRIKFFLKSLFFHLHDLILPTAKRAGQGALAKKIFVFFALALYQDGLAIDSSWAAYTGIGFNAFIVFPVLTEIAINLLKKALSSNYKKPLDTAHLIHASTWNGIEIWVYSTLLSVGLIENSRSDYEITPNEYIICFATSSIMGILASARHIYIVRSKQQAVAAQQAEEELIEITEPTILEITDSAGQHSPRHASSSYQQLLPGLGTNSNVVIKPTEEIPEDELLVEGDIPNDLSNASDSPLLRSTSGSPRAPSPTGRYSFIYQSTSRASPQHSPTSSKASDDSDVDYHRIINGNSFGTREPSPNHLSMSV